MSSFETTYCFLVPVWNKFYIDIFLNFALPSHLAPGNLGALSHCKVEYIIYTFAKDIEYFKAHATFKKLLIHAAAHFEIIEENVNDHRLHASYCYQQGINYAIEKNARVFTIIPDGIFSKNSFKFVDQVFKNGYRGIMAPCHSVEINAAAKMLQMHTSDDGIINLTGRDCVDIVLQTMHNNTKNKFFEEPNGNLMPASLCWRISDRGVLSHSFHLPPIAAIPNPTAGKFSGAIDLDFMITHCPNPKDIYIVQNSDDLALCELIPEEHIIDAIYQKGNLDHIIDWAIVHANSQHRSCFKVPLLQKSNKYIEGDPQWFKKEFELEGMIEQINSVLDARLSWRNLFKYKYAYIRSFIQQQKSAIALNQDYFMAAKILLGLHKLYLKFAQVFMLLQRNLLSKFYVMPKTNKCKIWNVHYHLARQFDVTILASKQSISLENSSDSELVRTLSLWLNKPTASDTISNSDRVITLKLNKNMILYINRYLPSILSLQQLQEEPCLIQFFKLPIRVLKICCKVTIFNFMLDRLLKNKEGVMTFLIDLV